MIKIKAKTKEGKDFIILGLSELNVLKLKEGKPIHITDERFFDGEIAIVYGKTEERIAADLSEFISNETKIINEMGNE